jgi:adenylosuccinate lyase
MLAHTHGHTCQSNKAWQEIMVFVEQDTKPGRAIYHYSVQSPKFGGATGNFNAHHVASQN